jgi:tetratricopeptide (TPR) repeat protein
MSSLATPNDDSLSPADLEQVIAVCERFEETWRAHRPHRIEDLLSEVPGPLRPRLLRELLALELELRHGSLERSGQEKYRSRFANRAKTIRLPFQHECSAETDVAPQAETVTDGQTTQELDGTGLWEEAALDRTNSFDATHSVDEIPGTVDAGVSRSLSLETQLPTPVAPGSSSWASTAGYEILTEIGRGGMGVVYKARHRGLNRLVALKLIHGGVHAWHYLLRRLQIEAETIARLRHENIVQVYDVGEMNGDPYVALELLEGGTLAAKLAGTPQPDRLAAEMSRTLARAIHAAHQVGVVHRDLKPPNVLLDESGRLKIADFGLAKCLEVESGQTQSGQVLGTPSYMAPEQARGQVHAVGPAADVYALGAILYEMLTGRPPFKGPTPLDTVRQVIHDDPVPLSRLQSLVSHDLETICLKCLAKEPHRRYASAADMADDLDRYLDGRPILARRTPAWEVGVKWGRRHPMTTMAAALGLAASVALAATWVRYQNDLADRLSEGTSRLLKGQDELAKGRPHDARLILSNLLTETKDEPLRLAKLRSGATTLLSQADMAIDRDKAEAAQRVAAEQSRERFGRFREEKDKALYHQTQFAGLDPSASRCAARASAEAALAVFGPTRADGSWSLSPLPESLTQVERHDVEEGCYVLLLILAQVEGRPDEALRRLAAAAKLHPPTWAYQRRLADCLALQGDDDGAEEALLGAEDLALTTAFDYFLAGLERYGRREWAEALGHFDAALRLQPDHFWANALSAVCCLQPELKRAEQAKAHLNAALQREPGFAWLYVLRGFASYQAAVLARDAAKVQQVKDDTQPEEIGIPFEPAEADYRTAEDLLAKAPNSELRYVLLVNRGLLRLERRQWDGAISDLEAAIRLDGRHYLAYATLAQVYQRQGKPDEAVAEFARAIALQPNMASLYRGRADVELNRSDPTQEHRARALRDLEQAIRLETPRNPVLARDQTNRALLLFREHHDEEALAACGAALAVVPGYSDAHLLRVRALLRLKRYDDARRSCDILLSQGKPSAEVFKFRQSAHESLDDFAGAIEDATQALALRPGQPAALLAHRGELYLIENSPLLAVRDFEEAVRLDPLNADAQAGLGTARVRLGRYREALADAEEAVRLGAADHRVLYKAARVYALAAVDATSEIRRKGRDAVAVVARYQDRAVELIRAARIHIPAAGRANFEAVLQKDPAIDAIRRRLRGAVVQPLSQMRPGLGRTLELCGMATDGLEDDPGAGAE